jgi:hypothetical protein
MSYPAAPPKIVAVGSGTLTRVSRSVCEPIAMPGQKIRVQLGSEYTIYEVPRYDQPRPLPEVPINVASFSAPLSAMLDSGSQTGLPHTAEEWDLPTPSLGQYWIYPKTAGVRWTIGQPNVVPVLENSDGYISIDNSMIYPHYITKDYGAIPQFWVFGDQTPIQLTAYNMDMNATKKVAVIVAWGFKYNLVKIETQEDNAGNIIYTDAQGRKHLITTVMTVNVGQTRGR